MTQPKEHGSRLRDKLMAGKYEGCEMLTKQNRRENDGSLAYHFPEVHKVLKEKGLLNQALSYIISAQQVAYNEAKGRGGVYDPS